jgi:hypothetical protein
MNATVESMPVEAGIATSLNRVLTEYREMPGLSLTQLQMQRLFGFDPLVCEALIDRLIADRVLRRTSEGCYIAD